MAKPDMGAKRQCQECGTKFFDMNRAKIVCPKCGTVFQVETVPARGRAAPRDDDEKETEEQSAEVVSLDEAEQAEEAAGTDDVEIEDDESADNTFLEEEEEDGDDVSGLIDGDIENDEES